MATMKKKVLAGKSIDLKIEEAKKAAKKANKVVANDNSPGSYQEQRNKNVPAIKAKNVRKALDLGKTAMRAKNAERKRALPVPAQLRDERATAQAMAKANAAKATAKAKPMTEAQKQAKALDALEAKRAAVAKKTGKRPNYKTN